MIDEHLIEPHEDEILSLECDGYYRWGVVKEWLEKEMSIKGLRFNEKTFSA